MALANRFETEWMDLKRATSYADASERTLREWMHRSVNPLPAVKVGGKVLISRAKFDAWLESHPFNTCGSDTIAALVDDVMSGIGGR